MDQTPPSSSQSNNKRKMSDLPTGWTNMRPRKGGKRRQRFDDLFSKHLPRSANVIDSNSMVNDIQGEPRHLLKAYVTERCPGSLELVDALFWVAEHYPQQLRTKELCETLESVTLIGADINALLSKENDPSGDRKRSMTIFDLACGHGLGGMLLAYRFPSIKVVCIDKEERPCWTSYREAFEKFGVKANKQDTSVTANLTFKVGDIMSSEVFQPQNGDYLMCLHGCNELSPFVLSTGQSYKTGFAVMPCCLRDGMLGVTTSSSNRNWGIVDDTARYSIQVGYLAGKFGVGKVAAISQSITNRFLVIIGDYWSQCKEQSLNDESRS